MIHRALMVSIRERCCRLSGVHDEAIEQNVYGPILMRSSWSEPQSLHRWSQRPFEWTISGYSVRVWPVSEIISVKCSTWTFKIIIDVLQVTYRTSSTFQIAGGHKLNLTNFIERLPTSNRNLWIQFAKLLSDFIILLLAKPIQLYYSQEKMWVRDSPNPFPVNHWQWFHAGLEGSRTLPSCFFDRFRV